MRNHPIVDKILNSDGFKERLGTLRGNIDGTNIAETILEAIDVLAREVAPAVSAEPVKPEPQTVSVDDFANEMRRKFSDKLGVPYVEVVHPAPMTPADERANLTKLRAQAAAEAKAKAWALVWTDAVCLGVRTPSIDVAVNPEAAAETLCRVMREWKDRAIANDKLARNAMSERDGWLGRALASERDCVAAREAASRAEHHFTRISAKYRALRNRMIEELTNAGVQLPNDSDRMPPGAVQRGVEEAVNAAVARMKDAEARVQAMRDRAVAAEKQLGDLRVRVIGEMTNAGAFLRVDGDPLAPGEIRGAVQAAIRRAVREKGEAEAKRADALSVRAGNMELSIRRVLDVFAGHAPAKEAIDYLRADLEASGIDLAAKADGGRPA